MRKWILAILSFEPVLYMVYVFVTVIGALISMNSPSTMATSMVSLFVMNMLTVLITLGLTIYYLVHAITKNNLTNEMRIIWVIILLVGNVFALPVYWFIYIRKETV